MSNTRVCETQMSNQQILVEAITTVMESIDPQLAQQMAIEVSNQQGLNNVRGVFYDGRNVDVKIGGQSIRPAIQKRLDRELQIALEGKQAAIEFGDRQREQYFSRMETDVRSKIQKAFTQPMYGDLGFRFNPQSGSYTYVYDEHTRELDHGFGPNFANEVAATYAAIELAQSYELQRLNATQKEAIHPLTDDEGNFGMGCLVEMDEDTLIRRGILQAL